MNLPVQLLSTTMAGRWVITVMKIESRHLSTITDPGIGTGRPQTIARTCMAVRWLVRRFPI